MKKIGLIVLVLVISVFAVCHIAKAEIFCMGNPLVNFQAVDINGKVFLSWERPCYQTVLIRYSYKDYPQNPVDGELLYSGGGNYYEMVPTQRTVYFSGWGYYTGVIS